MLYLVLGPVSQPEESACNAFFSGLFHYFFLIFWIKLRFNKHKKVTKTFFEKSFRYAQNGNWSILGSKLKLSFPQNKFIRRMNQLLD